MKGLGQRVAAACTNTRFGQSRRIETLNLAVMWPWDSNKTPWPARGRVDFASAC